MGVRHSSIRNITAGPRHHWFGYYDKLQVDPTNRRVLGMCVDFEHRSPTDEDVIEIGMVDLDEGDRWVPLGHSRAWCWQQGCMLQWCPGSGGTRVLWNDREGDRFVCRMLEVGSGEERVLPHPVYTLSADGRTAVGTDFRRIQDMRPGYGYPGLPDPNRDILAPDDSGIYRLDLDSGRRDLIIPISRVAGIPYPQGDLSEAKHYFNHLLFGPDGTRFIFLHRWRFGEGGFHTRLLTSDLDGADLRVVDDHGSTSHFIWRDADHILAWAWHPSGENGFYLYRDRDGACRSDGAVQSVGPEAMTANGHCTYLPGGEWVLNDTYPTSERRLQELYLYHVPTGQRLPLGEFAAPDGYAGEWRCDLHPRCSADGRLIIIDSAHGGSGRQMYLIQTPDLAVEIRHVP